jgi:hypothetical protein
METIGSGITTWPEYREYMIDMFQRSVLFLDLLRRRGNEEIEITSRPMATLLRFDHECKTASNIFQLIKSYQLPFYVV